MFGTSRQFGITTIARRNVLASNYKYPICNESSKYLLIWNRQLSKMKYSVDNKGIENGVTKRWKTSRISEGLSHHHHPGAVPIVEMTVGKLLENAAKKWPNRECVISSHQGLRLTYNEVLRRADKLAAGLLKLGLERGDRVGLWGPNEIEWFLSSMAIVRAGFIMVGVNPAYQQSEIDYCLKKVDARAVIAPKTFKTQNYADMLIRAKETCPSLRDIIKRHGSASRQVHFLSFTDMSRGTTASYTPHIWLIHGSISI